MDRLITIRSKAETFDSLGQAVEAWTDLATVWAERRDLRGKEFFEANLVNTEITAMFRIRWRADITARMQVVDDSTTYEIASPPIELGRREGLELMVKAVNP